MKTGLKLIKRVLPLMVTMSFITLSPGCKKSNNYTTPQSNYNISGNASGTQEIPPVSGTGTATITGTFNPSNNQFIFTSSWVGLSGMPTAGALYYGTSGVNGTIVGGSWVLPTGAGTSGSITDTLTLTSTQASQLTSGNWYFSYTTALNPTGEVRGQITATKQN